MAADEQPLVMTYEYPHFPFYVSDWLTGEGTTRMTPEQKGGFIDLLAHAWKSKPACTLPDDEAVLAKLSGLGQLRWKKAGALIRLQFVPACDGRIMNRKQVSVYQDLLTYSEQKSEAGKKGVLAKQRLSSADAALDSAHHRNGNGGPTNAQPSSSSSSSNKEKDHLAPIPSDETADRAAAFLERYPAIYARVRFGARYLVRPARDYHYAVQLADGWDDDVRLDKMAEIFLRMSHREALNIPGTPGQFLHMAPECDARLREAGQ